MEEMSTGNSSQVRIFEMLIMLFFSWLHKEATIIKYTNTRDPQYLALDVLVTSSTYGKLRSNFPNIRVLTVK